MFRSNFHTKYHIQIPDISAKRTAYALIISWESGKTIVGIEAPKRKPRTDEGDRCVKD